MDAFRGCLGACLPNFLLADNEPISLTNQHEGRRLDHEEISTKETH